MEILVGGQERAESSFSVTAPPLSRIMSPKIGDPLLWMFRNRKIDGA